MPRDRTTIRRYVLRVAAVVAALALVLQIALAALAQTKPDTAPSTSTGPSTAPDTSTSPSTAPATTSAPSTRPTPPAGGLGTAQDTVIVGELPGTWVTEVAGTRQELVLRDTGAFRFGKLRGSYYVKGSQLFVRAESTIVYDFELSKTTLTLRGGDLRKELKFNRQTTLTEYIGNWFDITPKQVRQKMTRVIVVIGIVLASRLLIVGLQALSAALIYSKRGPMKYVYQYNRRRVRTLHLLGLNVIKYIIYFTALGFVLSELGVDYTAYLASLSVVGLAIGFGSQGLVSDMVTGFFVIFEGQFDVGDMVELSGQTGVITEFGLRTTSLRNYFGQTMVIPNRHISVVGNYGLGGQRCTVDVAIDCPAIGEHARDALRRVTEELSKQFVGVIVGDPQYDGPLSLTTGECFMRVHLAIWPRQEWVIDQQLIPRIRELFARENLRIPGDRIVAFYHTREEHSITSFAERLQRRFRWRGARPDKEKGEGEAREDFEI